MRNSHKIIFCVAAFIIIIILTGKNVPVSSTSYPSELGSGQDYSYDFSIRITYRSVFGTVDYADLPMGIIMEEDETTIIEGSHSGGLLTSLMVPPHVEKVSTISNATGWVLRANGTAGELGGAWGWSNYSTQGGWSSSEWSPLNKSMYLKILKWIIVSNITIIFYGGVQVSLPPTYHINVTRIASLTESGWVYNTSALSSFPENRVKLDVEAHIMTIYVGHPPLFLTVLLIAGGIIAAAGVSLSTILRRRKQEGIDVDQVPP